MATPEEERDEVQTVGDDEVCCCSGLSMGKTLGWALLGAAITVPAVIYYLTRHLMTQGSASLGRAARNRTTHNRAADTATQRITIPVQVTGTRQEPEPASEPDIKVGGDQTAAEPVKFLASTESDKFHVPGCRWAKNIQDANRITFATRDAALSQGYIACNTCHP